MGNLPYAIWTAIQRGLLATLEPKLGRDHDLFANRRERFTDQFFTGERTINLCSIKKCDSTLDRRANQRHTLFLFYRDTIAEAQTHAAQSEGRNLKIAMSKCAPLHRCSLEVNLGRNNC